MHINFKGYVYSDFRILQRAHGHGDLGRRKLINVWSEDTIQAMLEEKQGYVQEDRK